MPEVLYVGDEAVLSAVKQRRKCGETVKPRVFRKPERDGRGKAVKARGLGTELAIGRVEIGGRPYASYSYGHLLLVPDSHICKNIYGAKKCDLNFVRNENTDYGIEFDSDDLKLVDYMSAGKKDPDDEYTEWIAVNE